MGLSVLGSNLGGGFFSLGYPHCSGAYPALSEVGSGGSVLEVWGMRLCIHLHLVLRFGMSGAMPILPFICLNGMHKTLLP